MAETPASASDLPGRLNRFPSVLWDVCLVAAVAGFVAFRDGVPEMLDTWARKEE